MFQIANIYIKSFKYAFKCAHVLNSQIGINSDENPAGKYPHHFKVPECKEVLMIMAG